MNENPAPQPEQDEEGPWYLRNPFFEHEAARVKALPLPEHEQHIIGEACSDLEQESRFDPELLTIIERLASTVESLRQENQLLIDALQQNSEALKKMPQVAWGNNVTGGVRYTASKPEGEGWYPIAII